MGSGSVCTSSTPLHIWFRLYFFIVSFFPCIHDATYPPAGQWTLSCFNMAPGNPEEMRASDTDTMSNTGLVAALFYGVAIGGLFNTPTPYDANAYATDTYSKNHLGYLFGSPNTNGTLWCLSAVLLLVSTLSTIFVLAMLRQIDVKQYELFNEVLWKPTMLLPYILCCCGLAAQLFAFLSFLTIHWGEKRTLHCVLACFPFAGLCQQLLFARLTFATGAPLCRGMAIVLPLDARSCAIGLTVATKDFLDKLPQHTMTAPAIAAALERYVSERSDVFEKARKKRPP